MLDAQLAASMYAEDRLLSLEDDAVVLGDDGAAGELQGPQSGRSGPRLHGARDRRELGLPRPVEVDEPRALGDRVGVGQRHRGLHEQRLHLVGGELGMLLQDRRHGPRNDRGRLR
jgi:hypothetical protein